MHLKQDAQDLHESHDNKDFAHTHARTHTQFYATDALRPGEEPKYPLNRKLGGSQNQSGWYGEENNLLPLSVIKPKIIQP
jgi:hypothetical protein